LVTLTKVVAAVGSEWSTVEERQPTPAEGNAVWPSPATCRVANRGLRRDSPL